VLTQDNNDVFDEMMNGGEDVWAALDGHAGNKQQHQHEPRDETND
jgi:hypothetical protein